MRLRAHFIGSGCFVLLNLGAAEGSVEKNIFDALDVHCKSE